MQANPLLAASPGFSGTIGIARWEITPEGPVFNRNWGAATTEWSTGVHRPLTGTACTFRVDGDASRRIAFLSLDLGWWRSREREEAFRAALCKASEIDESDLVVHLAHTHAGPALDPERNGDWMEALLARTVQGLAEAIASEKPSELRWHHGTCDLATHRDFLDPENPNRQVVGFNPERAADDTLLVGRITDRESGAVRGILVNYACHPTTLAWENTLLSPDYPGAMRELVESTCDQAPVLFLLGAAGELAPRLQYTGDTTVADRNGRILGHAVLSALEQIDGAPDGVGYTGAVESGASLGVWRPQTIAASTVVDGDRVDFDLPIKSTLATIEEIEREIADTSDPVILERLRRAAGVRRSVGNGPTSRRSIWISRLGNVLFVSLPFEAYSQLQIDLRRALPGFAVIISNCSNGWGGYLATPDLYQLDSYTAKQTPWAPEALETVTRLAMASLERLAGPSPDARSQPNR